nr:hypothetical protein [Tanacetum cinerariifolium]
MSTCVGNKRSISGTSFVNDQSLEYRWTAQVQISTRSDSTQSQSFEASFKASHASEPSSRWGKRKAEHIFQNQPESSHVQNDAMLDTVSKGTSSIMWKAFQNPVTHNVQPHIQPQFLLSIQKERNKGGSSRKGVPNEWRSPTTLYGYLVDPATRSVKKQIVNALHLGKQERASTLLSHNGFNKDMLNAFCNINPLMTRFMQAEHKWC